MMQIRERDEIARAVAENPQNECNGAMPAYHLCLRASVVHGRVSRLTRTREALGTRIGWIGSHIGGDGTGR